MKLLLDTHLLIWLSLNDSRVNANILSLLQDRRNQLFFSVASIWEIAIKHALGKKDFPVNSQDIRNGFLRLGCEELAVLGEHAVEVEKLPVFHKDPFDRLLIAQAKVEGITLLTSDAMVAKYPGPIQMI